jgi:hypothetical protein
MTAQLTRSAEVWNSMPGWGIVADLTPPELIKSRELKVLRKLIVTILAALLVLCVGGYVLAAGKHSAADASLRDVQARTGALNAETHKYVGVTKLKGTVTEVQNQIATVMAGDVDLTKLMGQIRSSVPAAMSIKQLALVLTPLGVAGGGLDTSGRMHIGTVTISGAGRTLDDLSAFVDKLKVLPGVVDVLPGSNLLDGGGTQYSLTLSVTDALLSHHFDLPKVGK